jgi:hypothetical protein
LGYFHLLLKGYDISKIELKAHMPPIGSLEDQMKLEMLDKQADILTKLGDVMDKYALPREAWIDLVFKKYMHLPAEIVDVFLTALPKEAEQPTESKSKNIVYSKLVEEINNRISPKEVSELKDLKNVLHGEVPNRKVRYREPMDILRPAKLVENDLIVSGFGQTDPLTDFKPKSVTENVTEKFTSHPGYRNAMDAHLKH